MVAYPYAFETACPGEGADDAQAADEAGLPAVDGAPAGLTGALPLPPHNDLFINPAFSYLHFLSDGSVVGPNGELYTPANYFPAHAAATAPVVDVPPPPAVSAADLAAPGGLLLPNGDYVGKRGRQLYASPSTAFALAAAELPPVVGQLLTTPHTNSESLKKSNLYII
jgi:hypothetical protein